MADTLNVWEIVLAAGLSVAFIILIIGIAVGICFCINLCCAYSGSAGSQVSVIYLHGTIGAGKLAFKSIMEHIDQAFSSSSLQAVVLNINSPGGTPAQCEILTKYLQRKAAEANVPIFAFVEDMAASGGYWLACAASEIYAAETSIVGSIGVVMMSFGCAGLMKKVGVESRTFTSGKKKAMLNPFEPVKESDVTTIERNLNEVHKAFINHVKESRGSRLQGDESTLFSGEIWTAKTAINLGLIDGIDQAEAFIGKKYGANVRVHYFKGNSGIMNIFKQVKTFAKMKIPKIPSPLWFEDRTINSLDSIKSV